MNPGVCRHKQEIKFVRLLPVSFHSDTENLYILLIKDN
jgi:hypothetical protein